jgi:hypothetical protein
MVIVVSGALAEIAVRLLADDELAARSEDDVYTLVLQYLRIQGSKGAQLSEEQTLALFGCCRISFCSARVQKELAQLVQQPSAGRLAQEYVLGLVAKNTGGEGGAASAEGPLGIWPEAGGCTQSRRRMRRPALVSLVFKPSVALIDLLLSASSLNYE